MRLFRICIPRSIPKNDSFIGLPEMLRTLRRNVREFLTYYPDEYIMVHGQEIVGRCESWSSGIRDGYRRFGLDPFLVQKVGDIVKPLDIPTTWRELKSLISDLLRGDIFVALCPKH